MASSSSSEAFTGQGQGRRVEPVRAATNIGALPLDALYDVLLRLPASKELCRLRLVCRSWRALLSDPAFAAAHAARYPEPLILVGCNNNPLLELENGGMKYQGVISIMDLSGHVVKQLCVDGHITSMSLNLACVKNTGDGRSCRLVNPATGAVHHLPRGDPDYGYSNRLGPFGQVASTREYKVLRKVSYSLNGNSRVLYEIGSSVVHGQTQWRIIQDPPNCIDIDCCAKASVAIDGVVYFLSNNAYSVGGFEEDWIASFDLETEMWRPNIRGPDIPIIRNIRGPQSLIINGKISLVNLNGSLVIVHLRPPFMNLWYLLDSDKGLWVRQYRIHIEEHNCRQLSFTPLIVLDDGRIVIHIEGLGMLKIYDPKTKKLTNIALTGLGSAVSVYKGSLLSLEWTVSCFCWQGVLNQNMHVQRAVIFAFAPSLDLLSLLITVTKADKAIILEFGREFWKTWPRPPCAVQPAAEPQNHLS